MYIFGGKTSTESVSYVTRMDLNSYASSDGDQIDAGMTLSVGKALPLIDSIYVNFTEAGSSEDIRSCYMVFAGQSYADGEMIPVVVELTWICCNYFVMMP